MKISALSAILVLTLTPACSEQMGNTDIRGGDGSSKVATGAKSKQNLSKDATPESTDNPLKGSDGADGEADIGLEGVSEPTDSKTDPGLSGDGDSGEDVIEDDGGKVSLNGLSAETGAVIANNKDLVIFSSFLQSTPEGTHKVGGIPCPAPFATVASIGECSGNGTVTCYGNINFCANKQTLRSDKSLTMLLDLYVTPENAHVVGGPACPQGFKVVGGFPDCGAGNCYGNQKLCAREAPINSLVPGTKVIVDFYMTPEGTHQPGAGCPAGFQPIGSMADCGLAHGQNAGIRGCQGNQSFCVKTKELK